MQAEMCNSRSDKSDEGCEVGRRLSSGFRACGLEPGGDLLSTADVRRPSTHLDTPGHTQAFEWVFTRRRLAGWQPEASSCHKVTN